MANARDILGPYPFRGLVDEPERYGDAVLALNVAWERGGALMRGRPGFALHQDLGLQPSRVLLCEEYRGRRSAPLLVSVLIPNAGGSTTIQVHADDGTLLASRILTNPPSANPVLREFSGRGLLAVPTSPEDGDPSFFEVLSSSPYLVELIPEARDPLADPDVDTGAYRDASDKIRPLLLATHQDRVFAVQEEDPWTVWYCSPADPQAWSYKSSSSPFGDQQEPLTAIIEFAGRLLCFTRTGIASITFNGQTLDQTEVIKRNTGCVGAVVQAGENLLFLSEEGLLTLSPAGEVSEGIGKALNRVTLARYAGAFADAQLRYYPVRRQVWLSIPGAQALFVYDQRAGCWATYEAVNDFTCLGTYLDDQATRQPLVGAVNGEVPGAEEALVLRLDASSRFDYVSSARTGVSFNMRWLGHPTPFLGFDMHRLFTHAWLHCREVAGSSARVFWLAAGQQAGPYLYTGDQYKDVPMVSPTGTPLVGTAVTGTATVAPDVGSLDFEAKVTLSGQQRGRWLQLGVMDAPGCLRSFAMRDWRLETRAHTTRRER